MLARAARHSLPPPPSGHPGRRGCRRAFAGRGGDPAEAQVGWNVRGTARVPRLPARRAARAHGAPSERGRRRTVSNSSAARPRAHRPTRQAALIRPWGRSVARALTEQAGSALGMDELRVAAPRAEASQTRVEVDPAKRGEIGVRHGAPRRSCVPHRHRLFGVAAVSVEGPILPWSFGPIPAR
jgi:hypothetical protein